MVDPDIQNTLEEYKNRLEQTLGDRLAQVFLYGSRSRRTHQPSSDIDVLCVLRGSFDYGRMIEETSEITSEISLIHDVVLSRMFVSEQDFQNRNVPFMMNARKEGILL